MSEPHERDVTTFRILGPLSIRGGGRDIVVAARRQRAVLAMLLLSAGRTVTSECLMDAVWPDGPPATGRTQVAICVTALRRLFRDAGCADVIVTGPRGYLVPTGPHRIDAVDFAHRVGTARTAVRDARTAAAIRAFTEALALWRGPALPSLSGRAIEGEVHRLEQERLAVHEELAAVRLAVGQHDTVAGELAVLVAEHPTRQTARAQLMLAQYRAGRRQDALATFADAEQLEQPLSRALLDLRDAIRNTTTAVRTRPDPVPAQLPADIPAFTGRTSELSVLDNVIADHDGPPSVALITGGPGVGKTGLAVHWAHRVARRFTDGQLFVDLIDADGSADTDTVLLGFLRALGVPDNRIPAPPAERAALYRSTTSARRMLVVLDNAGSFAQIAPLIPGGGGCCVVVTGRAQLGDLIDRHGATRLRLGPLDADQAVELLDRMVADARMADAPDDAARLAHLCDRLPLALRIAAARLVAKPHWTIAHLVCRLTDPARRLDVLSAGEQDVRAGLRADYRALPATAALVFRRLGTVEPAAIEIRLAAAISGLSRPAAEAALEALVDAHLLDAAGRDPAGDLRYRVPMLAHLFARELADMERTVVPTT